MSRREIEDSKASDKKAESFAAALRALRRGEVVVFPTETFYALGADALSREAVERVVALKGRESANPIATIVADRKMLDQIVSEVPSVAENLMRRFWPGPLTLVLPAKAGLPAPLLNRDGKIGVRVSSHPIATQLSRELGRPLTATSANPSGKEPSRTVQEARNYFAGEIELFLDGGKLTAIKGSTVAEAMENQLRIIREGEITSEELRKWL